MEDLKKPSCASEKRQVVVNIGKVSTHGGGGGIGGVILLGGVLATAAIASAFIFGKKGRGGSRDNSRRNTRIPPPPPPAGNKEDDLEEFTSLDADKHSSGEIIKEIEFKNDSQSLVSYEKRKVGVAVCDSEKSEQILCSITPKRPENSVISNGGVSHLSAIGQRTLSQPEIENTEVMDVKNQSPDEGAMEENGITEEREDFQEVEEEGEGGIDRETELMGEEIHEEKCEDTEESDVPEIGLKFGEGTVVPKHNKDGQESSLPEVGSPISKHENEKQDYLSSDGLEIIHDGEAIQQDEKDQLEHIEEHLVQQCKICDAPDEDIIPHKGEEDKEDQNSEENIEEKGYIDHSTPESRQLGDSGKGYVQVLAKHLPEDEPISPEEMEVSRDDAVNGEIEMSSCQQKDTKDEVGKNIEIEVEDSSEAIDTGIATVKDEEDSIEETDGDDDLSDETEQDTEGSEDSSMESNSGGVWPAEAIQDPYTKTQQEKLVNQEIEGKIQEDSTVKRGINESHPYRIISDSIQITNGRCNSVKSFIERHVADLATLKDHSTNSSARKVLLVAIPVLSSVSCSLFFGLSFNKFFSVVVLSILLSKCMIV